MSPTEITALLHREIPLAEAIGLQVTEITDSGLTVNGPFAANQNIHGTVFAGSIYCFATLASWTLVHTLCQRAGIPAAVVLQDAQITYRRPITDAPQAMAAMPELAALEKFSLDLTHRRKARLTIQATLQQQGKLAAEFSGTFVALRNGE